MDDDDYFSVNTNEDDDSWASEKRAESALESENIIDLNSREPVTGSLKTSEKIKLMKLLGAWEEPNTSYDHSTVSLLSFPSPRAKIS